MKTTSALLEFLIPGIIIAATSILFIIELLSRFGLDKATKRYIKIFKEYKNDLNRVIFEELRGLKWEDLNISNTRKETLFLRSYCRINSGRASDDIKHNSDITRILRSSISALFFLFFLGSLYLVPSLNETLMKIIFLLIIYLIGILIVFFTIDSYLYRLEFVLRSAISHFIALRLDK